jgi:uncharacterized protein YutE (UPF0331/DUF86 family)
MVDRTMLASKIASVRDAVARIRAVLPADAETFASDRTTREVVILNLFVALQGCMSLAAHWLADEGADVPQTYGDMFRRLGERGVIPGGLAARLAAASGLRNLVAHQYGILDSRRVFALASERLDDLLAFCAELAGRAG